MANPARRQGLAIARAWQGLVLLAILAVATGCGGARLASPQYDDELSAALLEVGEASQPVQHADLTAFDWDTAYVFRSYTDGESINRAVKQDVVPSSYQHASDGENVVVFMEGDRLALAAAVRRVGIGPVNTHVAMFTSNAWLVPADGFYPLRLVEELPDE